MEILSGFANRTDVGKVELKSAATSLEAQFIAETLKSAKLYELPEMFGGGEGEKQFSSFLIEEHARKLADTGGLGLSEQIYNILLKRGLNE